MLAVADGTSFATENLFGGRFRYVGELARMGADIDVDGHHLVIEGVEWLSGAPVRAFDIRAGAALVVAGLRAEGETIVHDADHLDRGYHRLGREAQLARGATSRRSETRRVVRLGGPDRSGGGHACRRGTWPCAAGAHSNDQGPDDHEHLVPSALVGQQPRHEHRGKFPTPTGVGTRRAATRAFSLDSPSTQELDVRDQVLEVIEIIRPAIQADGGDIDAASTSTRSPASCRSSCTGACVSCPASTVTMKAGIERIMKDRVPGVTAVVQPGEDRWRTAPRSRCDPGGPARHMTGIRRPPGRRAARRGTRRSTARAGPPAVDGGARRGRRPSRRRRCTHPLGGTAYTVGITGAPGAGQVDPDQRAVPRGSATTATRWPCWPIDPSSPFSGGAILGDRVRMGDHTLDDGVFIRSMATRGHLGGLALATPDAVRVLDAVGFPWVVIETVGVGQVEVEVAGAADTTVVVVNPGWGDAVQANKAGLMEIADVFVVNKADRPGAAETVRDLEQMLSLSASPRRPAHDRRDRRHRRHGRRRAVGCDRRASRSHHRRRRARRAATARASADELARADRLDAGRARPRRGRRRRVRRGRRRRVRADRRPVDGRGPSGCSIGPIRRIGSGPMADELVQLERRGDVAVVTLANGKVNALSTAVLGQLEAIARGLADDPSGAVLITGGPRLFAAGADISEFAVDADPASFRIAEPDRVRRDRRGVRRRAGRGGRAAVPDHRVRVRASRSAAAASWRWPATSGSRRAGPSSASPRSCWASSPAAAAPSGWHDWSARRGRRT